LTNLDKLTEPFLGAKLPADALEPECDRTKYQPISLQNRLAQCLNTVIAKDIGDKKLWLKTEEGL
jgi:hypothetical protein